MTLFNLCSKPKPKPKPFLVVRVEALETVVQSLVAASRGTKPVTDAQAKFNALYASQIAALQKQVATLSQQHATLAQLTGTLTRRLDLLTRTIDTLTAKGTQMENTQEEYNAIVTRLEADIAANGTGIQQIVAVNQTNATLITSLKGQIADLQKSQPGLNLAALNNDIDNLEHNTAGLTAVLAPVGTTTSTAPIITGQTAPAQPVPTDGVDDENGQVGTPPNPDPAPPTALDPNTGTETTDTDASTSTDASVNPDAPLDTSTDDTATTGSGTDATTATQDTSTDGVTAQTQAPS